MKIKNKRIWSLLSATAFVVVAGPGTVQADETTAKQEYLFSSLGTGVERSGSYVSGDGDDAVFDAAATISEGAALVNFSAFGVVKESTTTYKDSVADVRNVSIDVTGGRVEQLFSSYQYSDLCSGDVAINVSGGEVNLLYGGGSMLPSNTGEGVDAPDNITINISGGIVKQIRAAGSTPDGPVDCSVGNVTVNISGGTIGGLVPDSNTEEAILGSGGTGIAISGKVTINISEQANVISDIYAGASRAATGATEINISGGRVAANVYAGGVKDEPSSVIIGDTRINISGGTVTGNVYAGGHGGTVKGNTSIVMTGSALVDGVITGGADTGASDSVLGTRTIDLGTSDHAYTGTVKLDDFTDVNVNNGSTTVASMANVENVTVGSQGELSIAARNLNVGNKLTVDGTLNVDMENTTTSATGQSLTLGSGARVNVLNADADADAISVFGFDSVSTADDVALTLNGSTVSADMWSFENGTLVIKALSSGALTLSRNQSAFYAAVQAMNATGAATPALAALAASRDSEAVKSAIDALSGHEYATAMSSQIEGNLGHLRRLRGAMGKGATLGTYVSFANCYVDNKAGEVMPPTPVTDSRNWRVGAGAFHDETNVDSDARGDGYDRSETGAMLTAEYYVSEGLTLGGALSYGRTNLRTDEARRRHEDNTRFDVYALYGKKRWSFATSLGLGIHDHELERGAVSADADGYSVNFMQDVAYTVVQSEKSSVQFFGTLESSWNNMDSFNDGVLHADDQDAWATDVTAGVRYNRALPAVCGKAPAGVFSAQTGVTASIGDVKSGLDLSMDGYRYRQESATRNRWGWNVGAGVDVPVRANVSVYATADAVLRGDSSSVDGQIGVRMAF